MEKKQKFWLENKRWLHVLLTGMALLLTVAFVFTGGYVVDNEIVEVGAVSPQRYTAPRTIENRIATQRAQEEAIEQVGPLYKLDPEVESQAKEELTTFFADLDEAAKQIADQAGSGGVLDFNQELVLQIPTAVSPGELEAYYELTDSGKAQYQKEILEILERLYEEQITQENLETVRESARQAVAGMLWQSALQAMGQDALVAVLKPNLVLDEAAMEAAQTQKLAEVQPVMVLRGQTIVDEGEVVSEESYAILMDLGLINTGDNRNFIPLIGACAVVGLAFLAAGFYLSTQQRYLLSDWKKEVILFLCYLIGLLFFALTSSFTAYYMVPVSLFAMLAAVLLRPKLALAMHLFVAVASVFIFNGSGDYLVYALMAGSISALLMQYSNRRSRIIMVSVLAGLVHMAAYLAVQMFFTKGLTTDMAKEGLAAGGVGLFSVLLVVGSLPLWEAVFGINSQYRLVELANPTNELMRRLMIETPGTYHHSLVVANLAETAAYDLFLNGALARVGAYYHDIGKLYKPQYFSENQFGDNPHDQLDPYISAKVIIEHVEQGVKLAQEHHVPKVIIDMIRQHHGTTLVKYFYYKSAKEKPEGETKEEEFRYPGPIPQFKESAIVMLADTVEAAVRSSIGQGKSPDEVEQLIDSLFRDKLLDGQLDDCRLDLKELAAIKRSFLRVFNGMNHNRVAYPKAEEINAARQKEAACRQGKEAPEKDGEDQKAQPLLAAECRPEEQEEEK